MNIDFQNVNKLEAMLIDSPKVLVMDLVEELGLAIQISDPYDDLDLESESDFQLKQESLVADIKELIEMYEVNSQIPSPINLTKNNEEVVFDRENYIYMFCILLNKYGNPNIPNFSSAKIGKAFEKVVLHALRNRYNFAFEQIANVHTDLPKICEKYRIPFNKIVFDQVMGNYRKDGGVDIIGYDAPHPYATRGMLHLIQCAAGFNYKDKDKDITKVIWESFINTRECTVILFAVPIYFNDGSTTKLLPPQYSCDNLFHAGTPFERVAIVRNLSTKDLSSVDSELFAIIKEFCELYIR